MYVVWLFGLAYVYIWLRSQKKPCFIHWLWFFISLACTFCIVISIEFAFINNMSKLVDENYDKVQNLIDYSTVPMCVFGTTSHWIFSGKYLEMVLAGALFLNPKQGDL